VSINFKVSSVGNLGLVRLSKAILHAFLVSFRGTLGDRALASRQNIIVSGEAELFKRTKYQSLHYWRFVDDVWGLWTHG
jgi:hypothetical protein